MTSLRTYLKKRGILAGLLYIVQMLVVSLLELFRRKPRPIPSPKLIVGSPKTSHLRLALCLRAKDEGRFLPEWIAHHIGLGIQHIFIYDNGSSDESRERIKPFIDAAYVTFIEWPHRPASPGCYHHFLANYGNSIEWVGFLDADEFLMEYTPGDLLRTLTEHVRAPAIAVNWRYYGSSGHETIPSGLLVENFLNADVALDRHIKVLARPNQILACRNSHNFFYRNLRVAVTDDGRKAFGSFVEPSVNPRVYINHYVYRSRQDYARKARAGFVDQSGANERARATEKEGREFTKHNSKPFPMPSIYIERTQKILEELGFDRALWKKET